MKLLAYPFEQAVLQSVEIEANDLDVIDTQGEVGGQLVARFCA